LYIALGISGSAQHVAGLKNAEYVITVNTNKHAPICSMSDIVVEGDARDFVEGLLIKIEAARMDSKGAE
jgi:electron transfer flavoprotein alpha subunit